MTGPSSPDPATPQWTWTDEAREAAYRASARACGRDYPNAADVTVGRAVGEALAPHAARQVADLAVDRDRWMNLAQRAFMEVAGYLARAAASTGTTPEAEPVTKAWDDGYRAGVRVGLDASAERDSGGAG
jgi:hypothetical protein